MMARKSQNTFQSVTKKKAKRQAKIMYFAPTTSKRSTETLSDTTPNFDIGSSFQNKDSTTTEPVSSMYQNIHDSFENEAASVSQVAKKESEEMLRHLVVNKTEFSSKITDSVIWNETVFKSTCESVSKFSFTFHSL